MALQLISTLERQIFDFLGYMWLPMLANGLHFIVVILGIFGVYQYTSKHMVTYLAWCLLWSAWNAFVICYYLQTGNLNRNKTEDLLSFNTGSYSWWLVNNFGCKPEYFSGNDTSFDSFQSGPRLYRPVRPSKVTECMLSYEYVEVIHAGIQVILALFATLFGIPLAHYLITVVEPKYRQAKGSKKQPIGNFSLLYSLLFSVGYSACSSASELKFCRNFVYWPWISAPNTACTINIGYPFESSLI